LKKIRASELPCKIQPILGLIAIFKRSGPAGKSFLRASRCPSGPRDDRDTRRRCEANGAKIVEFIEGKSKTERPVSRLRVGWVPELLLGPFEAAPSSEHAKAEEDG